MTAGFATGPPIVAFDAVDYDNINSASHKNTTIIQNVVFYTNALTIESIMLHLQAKACSKRRILHAPNAFKTMDNEAFQMIIYCFECIRDM
jgi:hypothetical protein